MKLKQLAVLPLIAGISLIGVACGGEQPAPAPDEQPGAAPTEPTDPAAPTTPGTP